MTTKYSKNTTADLLLAHFNSYPMLQIWDIFKFIFQSSYGCEHMVADPVRAVRMISDEYNNLERYGRTVVTQLDGDFCRIDLSVLGMELTAETLGKLFYLSAKCESDGKAKLLHMLAVADDLIRNGKLPFSHGEFTAEKDKWEAQGYPAVHHSEVFRNTYKPAYRVISKKYVPYLYLFARLDSMLKDSSVRLAIEGGSAVGKTTLSGALEEIYGCTVFHMDDFFLRPEQRTPERFAEPGGNVDRERFLEEVLLPLSEGVDTITYRPFDCSRFELDNTEKVHPSRLCVIEGAYSMHPELEEFYDLSVFIDLPLEERRKRILKRNPDMADRFFNEWMPMEDKFFHEFNIKDRCTFKIEL